MIIYLLSGPRNCSTALMYSFSQRADTSVIDEPFYGIWLKSSNEPQPLHNEIMQSMECDDPDKVHDAIEEKERVKGNVFAKNMANTVKHMNKSRILNYRPVFLIRHPAKTIVSFAKVYPSITADDICLGHQVELYRWLKQTLKEDPIVIDGDDLRRDPSSILTQVCNRLDLSFTDSMLSWPVGPNPADGLWAAAWYKEVHASSGFVAPPPIEPTRKDVPSHLVSVYDQVLPDYQTLFSHSIRP